MAEREPTLGLDFGSSKACVSAVDSSGKLRLLADHDNETVIPGVILFAPDGNVLVGRAAVERRTEDPANTVSTDVPPGSPPIQTRAGMFKPVDVKSMLLDHMRRMADAALQVDTRRVVLTVPYMMSIPEREELAQAAKLSKLTIENIMPCPIAAAYAYGIDTQHPQFVGVCDFGASKFECSILTVQNGQPKLLSSAGDSTLGGKLLTERLVAWMLEGFQSQHHRDLSSDAVAMDRLRFAAEVSKRQLSSGGDYGVAVAVPDLMMRSDGSYTGIDMLLTDNVLRQRTFDVIDRMLLVCSDALLQAGVETQQLGQVLLIGGSTRIPWIRERLGAYFGRTPRMDVDPDSICALGAALAASKWDVLSDRITSPYGAVSPPPEDHVAPPIVGPRRTRVGRIITKKMFTAMMEAQLPPEVQVSFSPATPSQPTIIEVTASRLALSTVGGYCDEVIPDSSPIPTEKTRVFSTGKDNQSQVRLQVCQGQSRKFRENMALGTIVLADLPLRPRGEVRIAVTFSIDDDGVLDAVARDEQTGQEQKIRIQLPQ